MLEGDSDTLFHLIIRRAMATDCTRLRPAPTPPPAATNGSASYTVEHQGDWTWLSFPEKPPGEVLDAINSNGLGFRWSKKRTAWYATRLVSAEEIAETVPERSTPSEGSAE